MNNLYRGIWSESPGAWLAATEITKTHGKGSFRLSAVVAAILAAGLQMTASDASASTYAPANCNSTTTATIGQVAVSGTSAQPVDGTGPWSNILGCNTSGNGLDAVSVFGTYSQGVGNGAAVFGFSSTAGQWASALGLSANASGTGSTALGFGAQAQSLNSVAIGGAGGDGSTALSAANSTTASGAGAIAIGSNSIRGAQATATDSIAIGGAATAAGQGSLALGNGADAKYDGSVAIGAASKTADSLAALQGVAGYTPSPGAAISGATPAGEVSVGASGSERRLTNVAAGGAPTDAVNVSQLSTATASLSTSLNTTNSNVASLSTSLTATNDSVASLSTSTSTGLGIVAGNIDSLSTSTSARLSTATSSIGSLSTGVGNLSTSLNTTNGNLGSLSTTVNTINDKGTKYFHTNSTAGDSVASGQKAVAIGPLSVASGTNSFAAGSGAQATGLNAIAIGTGALATGSQAIGANARAGGGGVALGDNADAGGTPLSQAPNISKGTVIGFGAIAQQSGGVALGAGSVASTAAGVAGYVPAGAAAQHRVAIQATTSTQAAASVGDVANGQYRQITAVAAGTADSDAANVAQLKASAATVKASSVQYATNPDGSVNYNQITLGNGQAPGGTRIGNVAPGILPGDAVNVQQLNQVQSQVGDVARIAYSGTAMAFAMSGAYLPTLSPGEKTVGVGLGNYKGYSAVALTFKALSDDGKMSWGAGLSTTGKEWGVNAGVGWKWK
ncbi:Autotransporter adhesin [Variovorax sp. YR266]|uniref:YadA-like family protein n=1 Tax=Variovorax sp. YR266 TaxID=1884386 RepID=UPI00089C2E3C|nr:Autotransporter adhesin [Variovorax sp. YR266]